jgi:phosphoglycolate phosphatase
VKKCEKEMKNFKCVIFDLDGTLIDTIADIALFMNKALELHRLPPLPVVSYAPLVGWGMKQLAFKVMPASVREAPDSDDIASALTADAMRFYGENPVINTNPYPGIMELLTEVKRKKIKTAVLSNKPDAMAYLVVNRLFPSGLFDLIRGEISGSPRKPDPEPAWDILLELGFSPRETVFLGDSEIDMETALAAGCHAVGAAWGFRPRETLEKAGAQRIIAEPRELLDFLP